jgi:hypothetical protein
MPAYAPFNWQRTWHQAKRKELRGLKGTLFGVYYVARCTGKQIGGAYGYSQRAELPEHAHKCKRCFKEGK